MVLFYAVVPLSIYIGMPFLVCLFPHFAQHIFFLNFMKIPNTDYSDVKKHGRFSGRNFYLEANGDDAKLGVWHIFPKSVEKQLDANLTEDHVQRLIRGGKNGIIVYLHGNTSDRTEFHRCGTYQLLSEMNFHVLAVDYRGYGDSTGRPTEDGVVSDAKTIYNYARNYLDPTTSVYVWGHSMGTGVAARAVAELCDAGIQPKALVLESPFNNLHDVISHHPLSASFRFLPWFERVVITPLIKSGLVMRSDQHIKRITCPILVLHAQDDLVIPVELGRKLVAAAREANRTVKYVEFDKSRGFLHKSIFRAEELPAILTDFFGNNNNEQPVVLTDLAK